MGSLITTGAVPQNSTAEGTEITGITNGAVFLDFLAGNVIESFLYKGSHITPHESTSCLWHA